MLIVILDCNIVEFKVLKLIVNCLTLISFESRIKNKKYSSSGGNWSFVNFRGVIDETYNFRGNCLFTYYKFVFMIE